MSEPASSLWALRQALSEHVRALASSTPFNCALAHYVVGVQSSIARSLPPVADKIVAESPTASNTALLGFLLGAGSAIEAKDRFVAGVERCREQAAPSTGPSVHRDVLLLLGIAAGHHYLREEDKAWLASQLVELVGSKYLALSLTSAWALLVLGHEDALKLVEARLRASEPNEEDAIALLWVLDAGRSGFSDDCRAELEKVRKRAEQELLFVDVSGLDTFASCAALVLVERRLEAAIGSLEDTALGRLVALLKRYPIAIKRDASPPSDEYDVQRTLWTMLAGVYPDLQDERWLEQFGVYHPKADLAIESMKAIVEAKYIRKSTDFRKTQDQVVADARTYTQKPDRFDKVIAVIYDKSSSLHEHEKLRAALTATPGIVEAIIIPHSNPKPSKRRKRLT